MSNGAAIGRDHTDQAHTGAIRARTRYADPVHVVFIPDSFKGTLAADQVARAMHTGIERAAQSYGIDIRVTKIPFADGGEGTLDAVRGAWGSELLSCEATDALGRPIESHYCLSPQTVVDSANDGRISLAGRTVQRSTATSAPLWTGALRTSGTSGGRVALIEAAQANGLAAVGDVPLRPRDASTRGVGRIVRDALSRGVSEILLTVGGSATTDGGVGMFRELGAHFLDASGYELPDGGGALGDLAAIDFSDLDPRVNAVRWKVAVDVTNPLTGPNGAAAIFGPQKGAVAEDVVVLDAGLANLARVLREAGGRDVLAVSGLGAAGGMAAILYAFFDVELKPGWQLVSETVDAGAQLARADLVLTGEGRFDAQSLHGKVIHGVRQLTPVGVPLVVVAGGIELTPEELERSGVSAAFSICTGPSALGDLAPRTAELVEWAAYQVGRLWLA